MVVVGVVEFFLRVPFVELLLRVPFVEWLVRVVLSNGCCGCLFFEWFLELVSRLFVCCFFTNLKCGAPPFGFRV